MTMGIGWPRKGSIHVRLLIGLFVISALTLISSGIVLFFHFESHLIGQFDHSLSDKARIIQGSCDLKNGKLSLKLDKDYLDRIHDPYDPEFICLRDVDTSEDVMKSASFEGRAFDFPDSYEEDTRYLEMFSKNGERLRFLVRGFRVSADGEEHRFLLAVGHQLFRIEDNKAAVRQILIQVGVFILFAQGVAIFLVLRFNLRPLDSLSRQIEEASPYLNEPFVVPGAPSEIEGVVERLNLLMNRVEETIQNERRFSSLAAHELRTPLAGIRSLAEGLFHEPGMDEVLAIESRMERLVDNLLILSRAETSGKAFVMEWASPDRVLVKNWKPFFDLAERKEIEFRLFAEDIDRELQLPIQFLSIVLRNLFDNAVEYTQPGGQISAGVSLHRDNQIEFFVENGPAVHPKRNLGDSGEIVAESEDADAVKEERHLGLGLSICKRIARLLDARFEFDWIPPDRARAMIFVRLPDGEAIQPLEKAS